MSTKPEQSTSRARQLQPQKARRTHRSCAPSASEALGLVGGDCNRETTIHAIEIGGHGQEKRMAVFITQSIENLSECLTVKDAMKDWGNIPSFV
ncbi:hypothetical protein B0H12DRAFT_1154900 [Mycena haematopus]|nr:hypothetical protein B0H12DRAFT_1154900 [Mycena haematopus]